MSHHSCSTLCKEAFIQGRQFSVREVEVVTATVDIDEVVSYRGAISSLQEQASGHQPHPHIAVDFCICHSEAQSLIPTTPRQPFYHMPEEEIALGTANTSSRLAILTGEE